MFENIALYLEKDDERRYLLRCAGSRPYFDHMELSQVYEEIPKEIAPRRQLLAKAEKGESVLLAKTLQRKLKIHHELAGIAANNIAYEISKAQLMQTSILTSKTFFSGFLNAMSSNPDVEERNSIAMRHLSSIVPFVEDVRIADLIKLRERESLSFIKYRRALNEAIDEFRGKRTIFSQKEARTLYSDVIEPKLSSLDQTIRDAKRHLRTQPIRSTIALVGVIAFGFYTGFIPKEVIEIAKLLGLAKVSMDIQKEILALRDSEDVIKNEDLYFLEPNLDSV
jgi:hypothetical protein